MKSIMPIGLLDNPKHPEIKTGSFISFSTGHIIYMTPSNCYANCSVFHAVIVRGDIDMVSAFEKHMFVQQYWS